MECGEKRADQSCQSPYLSAPLCFICAFRFDCSPWKFAFSPVGHMSSSSVSLDFSSEHTLSCYLIKHPRDALEVIGFSTRRRGCRVEFVSMCAWIIFRRRCACLLVYWLCACYVFLVLLCFVLAVNHCVFRRLSGWVRHEVREVREGDVLNSDPRHMNFIILKEI